MTERPGGSWQVLRGLLGPPVSSCSCGQGSFLRASADSLGVLFLGVGPLGKVTLVWSLQCRHPVPWSRVGGALICRGAGELRPAQRQ